MGYRKVKELFVRGGCTVPVETTILHSTCFEKMRSRCHVSSKTCVFALTRMGRIAGSSPSLFSRILRIEIEYFSRANDGFWFRFGHCPLASVQCVEPRGARLPHFAPTHAAPEHVWMRYGAVHKRSVKYFPESSPRIALALHSSMCPSKWTRTDVA